MKKGMVVFLLFIFCTGYASTGNLTDSLAPVKVGYYISPPFMMKESSKLTGMAFDLWEGIADKNNYVSQYIEYTTAEALFSALKKKEIDIAVTNITVTKERARDMDFTFPWYDAGLGIMIPVSTGYNVWYDFFSDLADAGHVRVYILIMAIIIISTVTLTVVDRKMDPLFTKKWSDGLAESFYHVISIITTGKTTHKLLFGSVGKIIAAIWMVCGMAVIAFITSSITSTMTTQNLQDSIHNVNGLAGKNVGVRTGSEAERYLRNKGMDTTGYAHLSDATRALKKGEIRAIVADAPALEYYISTHPYAGFKLIRETFHPEKFGFALPEESRLTRTVSTGIIEAHGTKKIIELKNKYFK
ncbi:TPA: transporter substrate-binding domain-containing protein [Salmonella enterica]|nr:transporter substrate-binding domain-containing protein [Salmonella enterica]